MLFQTIGTQQKVCVCVCIYIYIYIHTHTHLDIPVLLTFVILMYLNRIGEKENQVKRKNKAIYNIYINRIQNKSFCLHNLCVHVYIYYIYIYIYKYKHMHVYISEKYVYKLNIFIV